eukprot:SM000298S10949  [mRNA]  locus=s298:79011:81460:- [translate_table: standard]
MARGSRRAPPAPTIAGDAAAARAQLCAGAALRLREALELLDEPAPAGGSSASRAESFQAVEAVVRSSNQVALCCGSMADELGLQACTSSVAALTSAAVGLIVALHGTSAGSGRTLLAAQRAAAAAVVEECLALIYTASAVAAEATPQGLATSSNKSGSSSEAAGRLSVFVGRVWSACKVAKLLPADNRAAVGREVAQLAASVRDVVREMGEMGQPAARPPRAANGADDVTNSDNGDQREESSSVELSANFAARCTVSTREEDRSGGSGGGSEDQKEAAMAAAAAHADADEDLTDDFEVQDFEGDFDDGDLERVAGARALCELLLYAVSAWPPGGGTPEPVAADLEAALDHTRAASRAVDELGASLYPPQDDAELRRYARDLAGALGEAAAALGRSRALAEASELSSIATNTALEKLDVAVGACRAAATDFVCNDASAYPAPQKLPGLPKSRRDNFTGHEINVLCESQALAMACIGICKVESHTGKRFNHHHQRDLALQEPSPISLHFVIGCHCRCWPHYGRESNLAATGLLPPTQGAFLGSDVQIAAAKASSRSAMTA